MILSKMWLNLCFPLWLYCSSYVIATDYGLDGPGSNPVRDEIFRPSRPALGLYLFPTSGPHQAYNGITLPLPLWLYWWLYKQLCTRLIVIIWFVVIIVIAVLLSYPLMYYVKFVTAFTCLIMSLQFEKQRI